MAAYEQLISVSGDAVNGQVPKADGVGSYTWSTPESVPNPSSSTPAMDGTGSAGSSNDYARGDHVHPTDTSRAESNHTHGSITNIGALNDEGISISIYDRLPIIDFSDRNLLKRTGTQFDGSTTTKALTPKGTWETFLQEHQDISGLAPKASPALTGTPTAPTAAAGTNTTQIATTAFVKAAVDAKTVPSASSTSPKMDGTATVGTETAFARGDHIHPTDTSRAPLASPALTGTPTAPTAASGTNTTQIATTAFVKTEISSLDINPVVKVNCGTFSSLPITVNSSMITADMELIHAEIGSINTQTGDWTVTTANGSVTVSGTITGSTTLILYLCVPVVAS